MCRTAQAEPGNPIVDFREKCRFLSSFRDSRTLGACKLDTVFAKHFSRRCDSPASLASSNVEKGLKGICMHDIVDTAVAAGSFKTLVAAVGAAGLVETLKGAGPFTVFAPTDDAFAKLPKGTVESLILPENKTKLVEILTHHVVAGKVMAADVVKLTTASTVAGKSVAIAVKEGKVKIDDATVVTADVLCTNGVIHIVDSVILPK